MTTEVCEWFQWLGGATCEQCGQPPEAHRGLDWIDRENFSLFGDKGGLRVAWEDYGPGRKLDVPLFTHYFGVPSFLGEVATSSKQEEGASGEVPTL